MDQRDIRKNIIKSCFSTISARLIFVLISKKDFCTRKELLQWTGFSIITISRYLQIFRKAGLIDQAPGIIYFSTFGNKFFKKQKNFFSYEKKLVENLFD